MSMILYSFTAVHPGGLTIPTTMSRADCLPAPFEAGKTYPGRGGDWLCTEIAIVPDYEPTLDTEDDEPIAPECTCGTCHIQKGFTHVSL